MSMSSWCAEVVVTARAARGQGRIAALAGLLGAGLLLAPLPVRAAERGAQQAASPTKESPYARYAREHAKTAEKKPARVKPVRSVGSGPHAGAQRGRH